MRQATENVSGRISIASYIVLGLISFWLYTASRILRLLEVNDRSRKKVMLLLGTAGFLVVTLFTLWLAYVLSVNYLGLVLPLSAASQLLSNVLVMVFAATSFYAGVASLFYLSFRQMKRSESLIYPSDLGDRAKRWEHHELHLSLFLVAALILCTSPVITTWNIYKGGALFEPWYGFVAMFIAAGILHLWGTRLLINTVNEHIAELTGQAETKVSSPIMPAYDVFVSYRRSRNAETARLIRISLQNSSYRVFLDVDDLSAGHFDDRLLEVISRTPNFIVILDNNSFERKCEDDWLVKEVQEALVKKRNIIPILMEGFAYENIDERLASLSTYHSVNYSHEYFEACMQRVGEYLDRS